MIAIPYIIGFGCLVLLGVLVECIRSLMMCSHDRRTWPMRGKQVCLQCGRVRDYHLGGNVGKWERRTP